MSIQDADALRAPIKRRASSKGNLAHRAILLLGSLIASLVPIVALGGAQVTFSRLGGDGVTREHTTVRDFTYSGEACGYCTNNTFCLWAEYNQTVQSATDDGKLFFPGKNGTAVCSYQYCQGSQCGLLWDTGVDVIWDLQKEKDLGPEVCSEGEQPKHCGNPINTATGNKFQRETDISGIELGFDRYYNSLATAEPMTLGPKWTHSLNYRIDYSPATSGSLPTVVVSRPSGKRLQYEYASGTWQTDADIISKLQAVPGGGWTFQEGDARTVETYDASGRLTTINRPERSVQFVYNDGIIEASDNDFLLTAVSASDGRKLTFDYDTNRRLIAVHSPDGTQIGYAYDGNGMLATVTYADSKTRNYRYNESSYTDGANLPTALTGIIDERLNRFATFAYQADGRAISTEHSGGVESVAVAYNADGSSTVTRADGAVESRQFAELFGVRKLSQSSTSGAGSVRARGLALDSYGRTDVATDELGVTTDYDRNSRGSGRPTNRCCERSWGRAPDGSDGLARQLRCADRNAYLRQH